MIFNFKEFHILREKKISLNSDLHQNNADLDTQLENEHKVVGEEKTQNINNSNNRSSEKLKTQRHERIKPKILFQPNLINEMDEIMIGKLYKSTIGGISRPKDLTMYNSSSNRWNVYNDIKSK